MYKPYLSVEEYTECGGLIENDIEKYLISASRHIDSLTFNRIVAKGFENLTEFQQDIIKETVAKQAEFIFENSDILNSPLNSYSISGVSMSFDKSKIVSIGSVITTSEIYGLLLSTGLCYRGI